MSNDDIQLVGKQVKDMYGTSIGRVLGRITDIDGSFQSVGIDGGSQGLLQIPFEQLVIQDNIVIYIPKWRLESQRLLREKDKTLRRLKALIDIVSDNDEMREDAEIIREKYKAKLSTLKETENKIKAKLEARLEELNEQMKSVKMLEFDAKVQCRSNEVSEQTFDSVRALTAELVEHITHETTEISNVQRRIADLNLEVQNVVEPPQKQLQESASIYLDAQGNGTTLSTMLPEAPKFEPISEPTTEPEVTQPTPEPETEPEVTQPTPEPETEPEVTQPTPEPETEPEVTQPTPEPETEPEPEVTQPLPEPPERTSEELREKKSEDPDWLKRMQAQ
ncbi:MAG: CdvA-like protein [Thaumarchaeota archaeon]|nr:CdvA-like protein [Nitrososphaerota archaeon]